LLLSVNKPDMWAASTGNILEPLRAASEAVDPSSVWAWLVAFFASIGSWFAAGWHTVLPSVEDGAGQAGDWFSNYWRELSEFLVQPHIRDLLIVWFVVFWIALFIPLLLGFGPAGVLAGSAAAWFQSAIYGAFTPAGGLFAVLTSVGMMGIACPPAILLAVVIASAVAGIVWGAQS